MNNISYKHHLVAGLVQPFGILAGWFVSLATINKFVITSTITRHKIIIGSLLIGTYGGYFLSQNYLKLVKR